MDASDTTLDEITLKQLIWCGHVDRMDRMRLPKIMINWKPEGRKKRGRPRRAWKDGIYAAVSERGLRMSEWNNRKATEYGSCKASPDVLKPHIYINFYIFWVANW